jgi:ATPase subunit of ABC transporter with duplicated ATPase domains
VASRILYLVDGRAKMYEGNYSFFREKQETEAAEQAMYEPVKEKGSKQDYLSFKEKSKQRAKLKKQMQSLRSKIADMERDLKKCLEEINHGIPKSDWEALQTATDKKKQLEEEILELYEQLEALENNNED